MNVLYVSNDNYIGIAGVSIYSLLDCHRGVADSIHIFLVSKNVSENNLKKIRNMIEEFGAILTILLPPHFVTDNEFCLDAGKWGDPLVYSRLALQELFQEYPYVERVLYIDCDTLVVGNLMDLWNIDLDSKIGAAVCEAMGNFHKRNIGLAPKDDYYNSGVFLMDIEKLRSIDWDKCVIAYLKNYKKRQEYPDEGVLNYIAKGKMLRLPPKYNMTSLSFYYTVGELKRYRKSTINYTEKERQESLEDVRIIHFTSTYNDVRPWICGCKHPYGEYWEKVKEQTPWKQEKIQKDNRSSIKKFICRVLKLFPRNIEIELTGFVHSYIKPIKYISN